MKLTVMTLTLVLALAACDGTNPPVVDSAEGSRALNAADGGEAASGRPPGIAVCFSAATSDDPAVQTLWDAMTKGKYAQRDLAIEQLTAAAAAQPQEERFALLLALAHLWRLAESRGLWDLTLALESAQTSEREFERAFALCPSDVRILAWLGPLKIKLGDMLGDATLRVEGVRLLEQAIERYPVFASFSNIVAYGGAALDGPDFQKALATARSYRDLYQRGGDSDCVRTGDPSCLNTPNVPHNIEGTTLFMGDVFVRAQDRASALASYKSAITGPDAAGWSFQDLVNERIRNLDANLSAAKSETLLDDPEWAWASSSQCSLCHLQ